jgi:hypothetical protein
VVEIRSLLRLVPNNRPITRPERPTIGSVISAASPVPVETHVAPGRAVDASAYDRWIGRWSRLFVPSVPCRGQYDEHKFRAGPPLAAAEVKAGYRVLDGADISPAMLEGSPNCIIKSGGTALATRS